jgi:hypothetical protein
MNADTEIPPQSARRAHARRVGEKWPPASAGVRKRAGRRAGNIRMAEPVCRLRRDVIEDCAALGFSNAIADLFGAAVLQLLPQLAFASSACCSSAKSASRMVEDACWMTVSDSVSNSALPWYKLM